MKRLVVSFGFACLGAGIFLCPATRVLAGPNADGTIFAHDADLVYTTESASYCGLGAEPGSCEGADVEINGATDTAPKVWKVYAAFCPGGSPRLKGMTFGVFYDGLSIQGFGPCVGDLNNGGSELPGPGWPGNGTGTAIVFQNTLTALIDEVYWFAGYSYYGNPATFRLGPHPDPILGGTFADDAIPSNLDDITGYGSIGFETPGATACPDPSACNPQILGACCTDPDGDGILDHCEVTLERECTGWWQGPDTACDPNPCAYDLTGACCYPDGHCDFTIWPFCPTGDWRQDVPCDPNPCPQPVPAKESNWGRIKHLYR